MASVFNSLFSKKSDSSKSSEKQSNEKSALSTTASKDGLSALHTGLFRPGAIVKQDIRLPWMGGRSHLAFTLDNVFTRAECNEMIRLTEAVGYGAALVNVGAGRQHLMTDVRNNTRCMVDDPVVASIIFERIERFLPATWDERIPGVVEPPAKLVSLNERLRFLRYTSGQQFLPHFDGQYCRDATPANPRPERSFVTVQLYLNDGEGSDFRGGSTAFLNPKTSYWDDACVTDGPDVVHCHPKAGRVLVFEHHLLHQGSPVLSGTKYALRTDAMYQPFYEPAKKKQQPEVPPQATPQDDNDAQQDEGEASMVEV